MKGYYEVLHNWIDGVNLTKMYIPRFNHSHNPKIANLTFFTTREEARKAGVKFPIKAILLIEKKFKSTTPHQE